MSNTPLRSARCSALAFAAGLLVMTFAYVMANNSAGQLSSELAAERSAPPVEVTILETETLRVTFTATETSMVPTTETVPVTTTAVPAVCVEVVDGLTTTIRFLSAAMDDYAQAGREGAAGYLAKMASGNDNLAAATDSMSGVGSVTRCTG